MPVHRRFTGRYTRWWIWRKSPPATRSRVVASGRRRSPVRFALTVGRARRQSSTKISTSSPLRSHFFGPIPLTMPEKYSIHRRAAVARTPMALGSASAWNTAAHGGPHGEPARPPDGLSTNSKWTCISRRDSRSAWRPVWQTTEAATAHDRTQLFDQRLSATGRVVSPSGCCGPHPVILTAHLPCAEDRRQPGDSARPWDRPVPESLTTLAALSIRRITTQRRNIITVDPRVPTTTSCRW